MKKDIHPKWYDNAEIVCACGKVYKIGSTIQNQNVEICSNCHPFFTGQEKLIDTEGRVERFEKKKKIAKAAKEKQVKRKKEKIETKKKTIRPKSLKEMVRLAREGK